MLEVNGINTGEAPDQWIGNWPQPSTSSNQNGAEARYLQSCTSAHSARLVVTICAPTTKYLPRLEGTGGAPSPVSTNLLTDMFYLRSPLILSLERILSIKNYRVVLSLKLRRTERIKVGFAYSAHFKSVFLLIHHSLLGRPNVPSTVLLRVPKRPPWGMASTTHSKRAGYHPHPQVRFSNSKGHSDYSIVRIKELDGRRTDKPSNPQDELSSPIIPTTSWTFTISINDHFPIILPISHILWIIFSLEKEKRD